MRAPVESALVAAARAVEARHVEGRRRLTLAQWLHVRAFLRASCVVEKLQAEVGT